MEKSSYLDNKYMITMMVAKRAKQLNHGSKVLVEIETKNNRLLALSEIQQGMVYIKDNKKIQNLVSNN